MRRPSIIVIVLSLTALGSQAFAQDAAGIVGGGRTRVLPIARVYDTAPPPPTARTTQTPARNVATAYEDEAVVVSSARDVGTEAVVSRLPSRFLPIARDYELPTMAVAPTGPARPALEFEGGARVTVNTGRSRPQLAADEDSSTILPRMTILPDYDDSAVGPPVVITVLPLRSARPVTPTVPRKPSA